MGKTHLHFGAEKLNAGVYRRSLALTVVFGLGFSAYFYEWISDLVHAMR